MGAEEGMTRQTHATILLGAGLALLVLAALDHYLPRKQATAPPAQVAAAATPASAGTAPPEPPPPAPAPRPEPEPTTPVAKQPQLPPTDRGDFSPTPVEPLVFTHVKTDARCVALTFDCCQTQKPAGYDHKIIETLISTQTPATFFLGGRWIEAHPDAVAELASIPYFELENHSYLHPHMPKIAVAAAHDELAKTQQLLQSHTGRPAAYYRPPFGEFNRKVTAEAAALGMQSVLWDVSTGDPDRSFTASDILTEFRRARPGSIIIMHANGRGWHTAEALPRALKWLDEKNLRPVTLSDLLQQGTPVPAGHKG
ncbi:MAG: polysaccharide deacetylase family protein [Armatimonadia bacterium]